MDGLEPGEQALHCWDGGLSGLPGQQQGAGLTLLGDQDGLAGKPEQHEIGFPVSEGVPAFDLGGA